MVDSMIEEAERRARAVPPEQRTLLESSKFSGPVGLVVAQGVSEEERSAWKAKFQEETKKRESSEHQPASMGSDESDVLLGPGSQENREST